MPSYSALPEVRQLTALLLAHGVRRCVLCPGSRNSPLVNTLVLMPEMECRGATDERSAGFMAIGWMLQSGAAVAVVVTSGSAALNLHPAVAEAHYQALPLLVISADRPAAWIGQQDGQTLPQANIYGSFCRFSCSLPEGRGGEHDWHRARLINEACLALRHHGEGPAHINLPLAEPLFKTSDEELEPQPIIERIEFASMGGDEEEMLINQVKASPRRMILVGQLPLPPALSEDLHKKGFVIIAEHLGNCAPLEGVITQADQVIGRDCDEAFSPDLLITVGGCIVSKRIKRLLRKNPPSQHWHMSRDGALIDTFCCLSHCLEGEPEELWDLLAVFADDMDENQDCEEFYALWHSTNAQIGAIDCSALPFGSPRIVGEVIEGLPAPSVLHLANSSAVRYAQLFALHPTVQVCCNRGTNGIEGSLSAAVGFAAGDDRLNVLLIGALSFFYDMNALSLPALSPNLRIVLLN
ncbi:MAG: 2-succinyl-5-enolpyruvyl-6-hydroxy-3-cyclohexene-1-carboxylic-acid synthase, partial [Akkermansia sp.]